MSYPTDGTYPGYGSPSPAPAQMGMGEAVSSVLSKYATFSGRARRSEYWWFYLAFLLVYLGAAIVDAVLGVTVLALVVGMAALVPSLAVSVRRLHDSGKSGWWVLMALVPLAGPIVLLVFTCQDSQPGANQWGPSPKYA
jgi:uncharacterized membrane protein YhaH (DUF805 family)